MNQRNKLSWYLLCMLPILSLCGQEEHTQPAIRAEHQGPMDITIVMIGPRSAGTTALATQLKKDLSWTRQFAPTIEHLDAIPTKKEIMQYADRGCALALFIDTLSNSWRLYDTMQPAMIKGKKIMRHGYDPRSWAHGIADIVWPILTNQDGFFATKIAYCKEVQRSKRRATKCLCIADYDGSNEQELVKTMVIAPRWNPHGLLFYSECTNTHVRLKYIDQHMKKHVVSNFSEGLSMLPTFSADGLRSMYCASRGSGNCQLYYCAPGIFKKWTHNNGNNVSPTLTPDGSTVYFCSDYETGKPAIYRGTIATGTIEKLCNSGLSPAYCDKHKLVAYIKNVRGTMQIFVYDTLAKTHEQITHDNGNKDECSWSPCGTFIIYSVSRGSSNRIAALHLISRDHWFITGSRDRCTYPAWSPNLSCLFGQQASLLGASSLDSALSI